jgi:hypothetical protein
MTVEHLLEGKMTANNPYPYRLAGLAMILGGLLMIPIQYLWLLSHGPTGYDERNLVFGLLHQDYEQLSNIPLLLILPGICALHLWQRHGYGRLGSAGYRLTMGGYILMVIDLLPRLEKYTPIKSSVAAIHKLSVG